MVTAYDSTSQISEHAPHLLRPAINKRGKDKKTLDAERRKKNSAAAPCHIKSWEVPCAANASWERAITIPIKSWEMPQQRLHQIMRSALRSNLSNTHAMVRMVSLPMLFVLA